MLDYSIELGEAKQEIQRLSKQDALTGVLQQVVGVCLNHSLIFRANLRAVVREVDDARAQDARRVVQRVRRGRGRRVLVIRSTVVAVVGDPVPPRRAAHAGRTETTSPTTSSCLPSSASTTRLPAVVTSTARPEKRPSSVVTSTTVPTVADSAR